MRDRIYIIDLNTKMYEKPKYKQYDNDIPFRFRIVENGVDVALTGYTVRAFFDNKHNVIQKDCTVSNKIIETKLDNNILGYEGEVDVEFTLIKENQIITTFTISLVVEKSINRNDAVELDPGWDILKDFQTTLDNAIKKAETNIKNTIDKVERDIENTITEANREIESAINQAERDVTDAIGNIPPKSELVGAKGVSMRLKGVWSSSIAYVNDGSYIDLVTAEGNTYACKISHINQPVSNTTYWELIAKKGGKGDTGPIGPQGRPGEEYTHPSTHPATMITEDSTHRFTTDNEKNNWNNKAPKDVATTSKEGLMSKADKSKLDGIASGANNYTHPSTHPAGMITEDSLHRFLTDEERKLIQAWETFKASGGTVGGDITANGYIKAIENFYSTGKNDVGLMSDTSGIKYSSISKILYPTLTDEISLGNSSFRWKDIFLSGFNKGSNGYNKLPNGMIIQWGYGSLNRRTTFPIAFPSVSLSVIASADNTQAVYISCKDVITTSFVTVASQNGGFRWIAIGY